MIPHEKQTYKNGKLNLNKKFVKHPVFVNTYMLKQISCFMIKDFILLYDFCQRKQVRKTQRNIKEEGEKYLQPPVNVVYVMESLGKWAD